MGNHPQPPNQFQTTLWREAESKGKPIGVFLRYLFYAEMRVKRPNHVNPEFGDMVFIEAFSAPFLGAVLSGHQIDMTHFGGAPRMSGGLKWFVSKAFGVPFGSPERLIK